MTTHLPLIAAIFGKESMPTCWTPNEVATFMIEDVIDGMARLIFELEDEAEDLAARNVELEDERRSARSYLNAKSEALENALVAENAAYDLLQDAEDRIVELTRIASV